MATSLGPSLPPLNANGEPIKLPENLESLPKAEHFPTQRHRWNTNEEIAAILISFERHPEWQSKEVKIRPKSGSMLLYSRKKVRYRRDGYCWKKRKDGKTTREDHMKLKVQGTECIYGCYVHSAILPTFHRRCYWLLQNPDIVLVHYLNVPYPDDNKLAVVTPSLALWADKKEWTKEELVSQLRPMFYSEDEPDLNNELEISTAETVEAIVGQLMEKQRTARAATLTKTLECGCPDSTCADGNSCAHPIRRISAAKPDSSNMVSSTTGGSVLASNNRQHQTNDNREQRNDVMTLNTQTSNQQTIPSSTGPLVLSLSQLQGSTGSLLILNNTSTTTTSNSLGNNVPLHSEQTPTLVTSFISSSQQQRPASHGNTDRRSLPSHNIVLKHEAMEMDTSNSCQMTSSHRSGSSDSAITLNRSSSSMNLLNSSNNKVTSNSRNGISSEQQAEKMDVSNSGSLILNSDFDNYHSQQRKGQKFNLSSGSDKGMDLSILDIKAYGMSDEKDDSNAQNNFFTLGLSHEEIQQTLSANLPLNDNRFNNNSVHKTLSDDDALISSMDFIDVAVSADDDVLVNLDAFDMLGDFPELEVLDPTNHDSALDGSSNRSDGEASAQSPLTADKGQENSPPTHFREVSATITDFSPEWAYPEGGVKVLVTGPWHSTSTSYTVLFDSLPVPTTLVQTGVLRCYCPAHEVGIASLQVACEGFVISNSAMFEYKTPPSQINSGQGEQRDSGGTNARSTGGNENDNLLRLTLMQRLEAVDDQLHIKQEPDTGTGSDVMEALRLFSRRDFEERLVSYCQGLSGREWRDTAHSIAELCPAHHGMTLLHIAAALGYSRLVCAMLHWRAENSSLLLDSEVDALSQDDEGFTPLTWACTRGHRDTALLLYQWNCSALSILNLYNQSPLDCARLNSHILLASEVERLEAARKKNLDSNSVLLCNPGDLSKAHLLSDKDELIEAKDDGVFLRPGAVTKNDCQKYKVLSLELHVNIPSLADANNPSPPVVSVEQTKPINQTQQTSHYVIKTSAAENITLFQSSSAESLASIPSPVNNRSSNNLISHSFDTPKLSRLDRSMSLPLNSPMSDSTYDSGISSDINRDLRHSPERRMDFALCEIAFMSSSQTPSPPILDVRAVTSFSETSENVGEQEVRVLTLAEQIIAAIPDRIKIESDSEEMDSLVSLESPLLPPSSSASSCCFDSASPEFNFELCDNNYRYYDVATPSSSLSPASSSCLQSPSPFPLPDSPSPPPTTADFCEFFQASSNSLFFEKDFSNLTLSDREQRELYEAAKIIQKAYRSYKGRKKLEEQDKERAAAVLIQNYYRRYKQFAYFKQMTHAAMVIQHGYRSYCENKRFKKNYTNSPPPQTSSLKRTYSQRRQHQAARQIQQFMRQSKNKLQRERASGDEKERQVDPCQDVHLNSPSFQSIDPNKDFEFKNQS